MKMLIVLLMLFPTLALSASGEFLAELKADHGEYRWDRERVVSVDLNRDGKADTAALGVRKGMVALAVQIAGRDEPIFREIPIDASRQLGICAGDDPKITVHPQSIAPVNALGENPSGYEVCTKCFELAVAGGECDPVQFYWDIDNDRLNWWRA